MRNEKALVYLLKLNHPEIYHNVVVQAANLPKPMLPISRAREVVNAYCIIKGIELTHFTNHPYGRKKMALAKKELYAVMLYIFNPDRLIGIYNGRAPELTSVIGNITGNAITTICQQLKDTAGYYSVYADFREQTERMAIEVLKLVQS